MASRDEVLELIRSGESYESAGRRLSLPPGQVYMIATGIPADFSDSLGPEDYRREGLELGATQNLLGVPAHNPVDPGEHPEVMAWVQDRARTDGPMQVAAATDVARAHKQEEEP